MASDKKRLRRAQAHWDELHVNKRHSIEENEGLVALLVGISFEKKKSKLEGFNDEAEEIAHDLACKGMESAVFHRASSVDFDSALRNRDVSTVLTIGHGSLASFHASDGVYDWFDVSLASNHIKTGKFVQRQCAGVNRNLCVPLGLFAVASPNRVWATSIGEGFEPTSLEDPINESIAPIPLESTSYRSIKRFALGD